MRSFVGCPSFAEWCLLAFQAESVQQAVRLRKLGNDLRSRSLLIGYNAEVSFIHDLIASMA
jgi:hypothetical protein